MKRLDIKIEGNPQRRGWTLTINNPTEHGLTHEAIREVLDDDIYVDYYCMSDEIGEDGTYHTHLYIHFVQGIRFKQIKEWFPSAHIEFSLGTPMQNRDYIAKEGKWANSKKAVTRVQGTFEEHGERPGTSAQKKSAILYAMIESGMTDDEIIKEDASYIMLIGQIQKARAAIQKGMKGMRDVQVFYYWGPTGAGKTYAVYDREKSLCRVNHYGSGAFDEYSGEEALCLDEFNGQLPIELMLQIMDKYELTLPARYYNKKALYNRLYICSNLPLEGQFEDVQTKHPEQWEAFLRRITEVVYFPPRE